jgi:murein DD-endopeptidase MepM/ murein hydrolase activator NlpD
MQILITDSSLVRSRALHIRRWHAVVVALLVAGTLMAISGLVYHFIFITAAREGWPVASQLVKLMVRDELVQRERVMRENLDAIAMRVGEMQAKLVKLEQLGERVTDMARVKTDDLKALPARAKGGQGGPFVPLARPTVTQLNEAIDQLDERADIGSDLFTLVESRLFEARLQALLVPSSHPVDVPVGSGFGFRIDPITGRAALHTGLDFPSDVGTAIHAAAGGMVVVSEVHPAYGNMIEIDHGNSLITRYAHASKLMVKVGAMVKRGQKIAEVGTSGRSTGPHLHFEVRVGGVPQDPRGYLG